jgi:hypothetical protein
MSARLVFYLAVYQLIIETSWRRGGQGEMLATLSLPLIPKPMRHIPRQMPRKLRQHVV